MKTLAQLGASPAPWSLNLETCTVVDAKGRPVLDNEFGVASMEDADMNLFIESAGLYECLCEATEMMCRKCCHYSIEERKCYDGIECQKHDCVPRKWRIVLAKAAGESGVVNGK